MTLKGICFTGYRNMISKKKTTLKILLSFTVLITVFTAFFTLFYHNARAQINRKQIFITFFKKVLDKLVYL